MAGSKKERHKNRLPPFVPLLVSTLDSPAWRAMSHGAKILYIALRRRVPNGRNRAYISHRNAAAEIGSSRPKVAEWFKELEHYGFIVLAEHGCLGLDGKGKAPHWRLTELGVISRASANDQFEPPTNVFLKWNGAPFKKQNPGQDGLPPWPRRVATPGKHGLPPDGRSGQDVLAIGSEQSGKDGVAITSITTPREISSGHGKPWKKPTITDLGERRFKRRRPNGRWA
jgi:hypothetical protein